MTRFLFLGPRALSPVLAVSTLVISELELSQGQFHFQLSNRGGRSGTGVRAGADCIIVLVLPGVCVRSALCSVLCSAVDTRSDTPGCMKVATSPQSASVCPGSTSSYHLYSSPGSQLGLGTVTTRGTMTSVRELSTRIGSSVGYNPLIKRKSRKSPARRQKGQWRPQSPN